MPTPRWVHDQGVGVGEYSREALLTVTDVRHTHSLAMTPVWEVEPHPRERQPSK